MARAVLILLPVLSSTTMLDARQAVEFCRSDPNAVVATVWPPAEAGPVADRHEECEARVIPAEEARRLRSRKTETGETLRIALRASRDAMQEYVGWTPPEDKASGRPAGA